MFDARLRSSVCGVALTIALLWTSAASAQSAPQGASAKPAASDGEPTPPSGAPATTDQPAAEIVITGTRLQNRNFTAPTPVTSVSALAIAARAPAAIADVVNDLPSFRTTRSAAGSGRTAGYLNATQQVLDLRGLGETRTLVLINGRRTVITNLNGSFDSNMIPVGLVDRIDVVTGGASAAYGSDAVAGVVNFVLKDHYQGISGSIQGNITEKGDGKQFVATFATGKAFAGGRGHAIFGADYAYSGGAGTLLSRSFAKNEPGIVQVSAAQRTALNLPAQLFANNVEYANVSPYGVITTPATNGRLYIFDINGNPTLFNQGTVFGTGASALMQGSTSNQGYGPDLQFPLMTKNDRLSVYGRVEFEPTDGLTLYVEGNYGRTHTPNNTTGANGAFFQLQVPRTSLPATVQAMYTPANLTIGRIITEVGGGAVGRDVANLYRGVIGAKGDIGDRLHWEIYYNRGRTYETFGTTGIVSAAVAKAAFGCNGLASTVAGGNPNLTAATAAAATLYEQISGKSCVAFNPLGLASASAVNYFHADDSDTRHIMGEDNAVASLSGTPITLWAGDVSFALGAEWRRETLTQKSNPYGEAGFFSDINFKAFRGVSKVKEIYGEIGVPLLRNVSIAKSLDVNGAVRRTDYSLTGAVTTWKVGATYEPLDGIRVRATQSRDIRAPTLRESFYVSGGQTNTVTNTIPGTFGFGVTGSSTFGIAGNIGLKPEKANTFTGGIQIQPHGGFVSRLRLSVDYYSISVKGAVTQPSNPQTLANCASLLQAGQTCPFVQFSTAVPNGIVSFQNIFLNLNKLETKGIDIELNYRVPTLPFGLPGTLNVRGLVNYVAHFRQTLLTQTGAYNIENAGSMTGVPKWTGTVNLDYDVGRLGVNLQLHGFSRTKYDTLVPYTATGALIATCGADAAGVIYGTADATDPNYNVGCPNSINRNHFKGAIYGNLTLNYRLAKGIAIYGGATNLWNKQPPEFGATAMLQAGSSVQLRSLNYNLLGRTYRLGARFNF
jgi:outer membrane receptor protein involved in Fe transport